MTSFANTDGGVIVYGVDENREPDKRGTAAKIVGISGGGDAAILRLINLIQQWTSPSLSSRIRAAVIIMGDAKQVVAVGIPQSLNRPHRENERRLFWRRNDRGKYEPDVTELREMFLESESWESKCDQFVDERIERLRSVPISEAAYIVVHVLPIGRLHRRLDTKAIRDSGSMRFEPLHEFSGSMRHNFEGFISRAVDPESQATRAHCQFFRFGGVEGICASLARDDREPIDGNIRPQRWIFGVEATTAIGNFVRQRMQSLENIAQVERPFYISLSLVNYNGFMVVNERQGYPQGRIDRAILRLPPALVEVDTNVDEATRSLTDVMWQASGWEAGYWPSA